MRVTKNEVHGYYIPATKIREAAYKLGRIEDMFPELQDLERALRKSLNKTDVEGNPLQIGDIVKSIIAKEEVRFLLCFGDYDAYCPMDQDVVPGLGYYAYCIDTGDSCPIGDLSFWALKIGNIGDSQYSEEAERWPIVSQNQS